MSKKVIFRIEIDFDLEVMAREISDKFLPYGACIRSFSTVYVLIPFDKKIRSFS
jgi:hypothetical protein